MKRFPLAVAAVVALMLPGGVASAHPLGNFTVNHFARVSASVDRVEIEYVLDEAEIPTFQENLADPEALAHARADAIGSNLHLTIDGRELPLHLEAQTLTLPPGAGGLPTLRLEANYSASFDALRAPAHLQVRDDNDPTRIGWREMVAAPSTGVSDALRQYPDDLLNSPLNVRSLELSVDPASPAAADAAPAANPLLARAQSAFADLANVDELTPAFVVFALVVALVLGAAHALQPGHGKTVVAAYLVGSRGTPRHALFLGVTVTATHTAGVYALGLVTLVLSQYIVPERLYPILETGSGLLVLGIGVWLLGQRALGLKAKRHGHHHSVRDHLSADGHVHTVGDHSMEVHSVRGHSVEGHVYDEPEGHHHPHGHAHVGWRSLLALGVSGGLLPCPEALMVLLITIAAHRVLFGLLLIVAFSTGLAGVLVGFGLLLVYARQLFNKAQFPKATLLPRFLPVASALVIVLAGATITVQALPQVL